MFLSLWIMVFITCLISCCLRNRISVSVQKHDVHLEWIIDVLLIAAVFVLIVSNRTNPDIINYRTGYDYKLFLIQKRELIFKGAVALDGVTTIYGRYLQITSAIYCGDTP